MRRIIVGMLALVTVYFFLISLCFADTVALSVSAQVPYAQNLKLTLYKLTSGDDSGWYSPIYPGSSGFAIDFGELELNEEHGIFLTDTYYALDCGVDGGAPWTIHHTVSGDIVGTGPDSLGDNIIVTFYKVAKGEEGDEYTPIDKMILANATDVNVTSDQLVGGWLRIFYGIATGDPEAGEPGDAVPITVSERAGTQTGLIEITLLPE